MKKYIVAFLVAFLLGLAWLLQDAWLPKLGFVATQPNGAMNNTILKGNASGDSRQAAPSSIPASQTTLPTTQATPPPTVVTPEATQPTANAATQPANTAPTITQGEPFSADEPYIPPEQRSAGNLGGPPPRNLMLENPQPAY